MKNIEEFVYLSQIASHDIFLYYDDASRAFEWLTENGYVIQSWEAFLETKNEVVRTLSFGRKTASPFRSFGKDITTIKNDIEATVEDWSRKSPNSRLIICLNLKSALPAKVDMIPLWSRIAAGILGVLSLGSLGMIIFEYFAIETSFKDIGWSLPISLLICAPLFLYSTFTGKGDLRFLSPEKYFKKRRKAKIKTETGKLRWKKIA